MKIYQSTDDTIPVASNLEGVVVGVFLTYRQSGIKRNFRCVFCAKLLFKYEGDVAMLLESSEKPINTGHSEHLCTRCRAIYHILW